MGIETLLLPGGFVLAIIVFWIALYKGISSKNARAPITAEQSIVVEPSVALTQTVEKEPFQEAPAVQPVPTSADAIATIAEAPPPFEDPQTAFTSTSISSTALPTDITAVTNISSPVENASPVLVIAKPKRVRRATKRLPANGAPRRRRSTRATPEITAPESLSTPGQQNEVNQ